MAFYTAYFDESESEAGPFFVFGGLVLDIENPQEFEHDWKAAIDPLPMLQTSPFLAGGKGFEHRNNEGLPWKQERLKKPAQVIAKYALWTFATVFSMDAFRALSGREKYIVAIGEALSVFAVCFALSACRSQPVTSTPTIVFSQVPAENPGAPDQTRAIAGRVTGARYEQRIVLYAKNDGRWGVQPHSRQPFTKIEDGGSWAGSTQLGSEYAALLVDPSYSPPELIESLPAVGPGVAALAIVDHRGTPAVLPPPKTIKFSGYEWAMSSGSIYRAGSRNEFDPANVWTDANGTLHLRISGSQGKWTAAEVKLTRSLGYGTYRFKVRDISHLEPSAVLTLVSWDGVGTEQNRRELDVELSRWGYINNDNAHYVVQPYYVPANIVRFRIPAGVFTHSFHWEPGQVMFSTVTGSGSAGTPLLKQHVFTSGVPAAGNESVRISLYVFDKGQVPLKNENEVVIEKFEYLP